jgi:carboxylesterase type B
VLTFFPCLLSKSSGGFYSFKNIPYAEPPVGPLRFRHPIPNLRINRTINDGSSPRICPQASQGFFQFSIPLVFETLAAGGFPPPAGLPATVQRVQSEDCLLLDVSVPKAAFDAQASGTLAKPLPVLLWIHGGAYTAGSKDEYNPAGLIAQSRRDGASGVLFVAINYRL